MLTRHNPTIIILGEHDKGLGVPFSPSTVSGRRLRTILSEIGGPYRLENVYELHSNGNSIPHDLIRMCRSFKTVVALGKVAEAECQRQGIKAIYLPHPAARSGKQLKALRDGLRNILKR